MGKETVMYCRVSKFCLLVLGFLVFAVPGHVKAEDGFRLSGYFRTWASMNLNNSLETKQNDIGKLSMLRGSALFDLEGRQGIFLAKIIGRFDGEYKTDYMRWAENEVHSTNAWIEELLYEATSLTGSPNNYKITGPSNDMMDAYNNAELRECYIEFDTLERVTFRLGKQQVVWGETDFFRAMDVVHGFDYRWRSFLEPENEELRKPLQMANIMIQVPEVNGMLQLLFRPGWDEKDQIGNRHATGGGRWSPSPYLGLDFLCILKYNYRYQDGDVRDPTGGARWTGILGPVEYSFAYLKTYNDDFCLNSRTDPTHEIPMGIIGDFVHPFVDIYGFTMNGYVPFIDSVLSTEVVFTPHKPYTTGIGNVGMTSPNFYMPAEPDDVIPAGVTLGQAGAVTDPNNPLYNIPIEAILRMEGEGTDRTLVLNNRDFNLVDVPGFGGIKRKDTFMFMFRVDKSLRTLGQWLNTYSPPFFTVQVFDQWIMNWTRKDQIIVSSPYGARRKEHSTMLTAVLAMEYKNATIKPQLAGGYDLTYDGGFAIPSCEFIFGDHWRLRAEADFFFQNAHKKFSPTDININGILNLNDPSDPAGFPVRGGIQKHIEGNTHMFGFFNRRDQFMLRLSYLF